MRKVTACWSHTTRGLALVLVKHLARELNEAHATFWQILSITCIISHRLCRPLVNDYSCLTLFNLTICCNFTHHVDNSIMAAYTRAAALYRPRLVFKQVNNAFRYLHSDLIIWFQSCLTECLNVASNMKFNNLMRISSTGAVACAVRTCSRVCALRC